MSSQTDKNYSLANVIGIGFLIFISALIIYFAFSGWRSMVINGNESEALNIISSIHKAQKKYASAHQSKYALNFDELVKSADLNVKLSGEKSILGGYIFEMKVVESTDIEPPFYSINADPQVAEGLFSTGMFHFYYDSTLGTIRITEDKRQAEASDPTI